MLISNLAGETLCTSNVARKHDSQWQQKELFALTCPKSSSLVLLFLKPVFATYMYTVMLVSSIGGKQVTKALTDVVNSLEHI